MLHSVAVEDPRVGMYVTGFDRSWLDVSLWRRRFPVADEAVLARVRGCGATAAVVDDARGLGPIRVPVPVANWLRCARRWSGPRPRWRACSPTSGWVEPSR